MRHEEPGELRYGRLVVERRCENVARLRQIVQALLRSLLLGDVLPYGGHSAIGERVASLLVPRPAPGVILLERDGHVFLLRAAHLLLEPRADDVGIHLPQTSPDHVRGIRTTALRQNA